MHNIGLKLAISAAFAAGVATTATAQGRPPIETTKDGSQKS